MAGLNEFDKHRYFESCIIVHVYCFILQRVANFYIVRAIAFQDRELQVNHCARRSSPFHLHYSYSSAGIRVNLRSFCWDFFAISFVRDAASI